jgi:hypothetical protein
MSTHINSLAKLNHLALTKAYDIEDIDWSRSINRERLWGPEELAPLTYLTAYESLNTQEKRRLNQLFSMGVCEQFIWLEENILVRTLEKVLIHWEFDEEFTEALKFFIAEEKKHTEMFWRVLEKAEPDWYQERKFKLFNTSKIQDMLINSIINNPTRFLVWLWMAIFFEEKTVSYCQHYLRTQKTQPESLDPTFFDLHKYHFMDEVRHFQLDEYLLADCYATQSKWKKKLSGWMFFHVMKSYTSPRRTSIHILELMGDEFPHLKESVLPAFVEQLPSLATNHAFHKMAFSDNSIPKALNIFKRYSELDRLWGLFCIRIKPTK